MIRKGKGTRPAWLTSRLSAWCIAVLAKRITANDSSTRNGSATAGGWARCTCALGSL